MRRKTRLAPIAKVTKEIDETVMPRRLLSCARGDGAAIFNTLTGSDDERVQNSYTPKTYI